VEALKENLLWRSAGQVMSLIWGILNLCGTETSIRNAKLAVGCIGLELTQVQSGDVYLVISQLKP
jgi:hypothetical protein